MKAMCSPPSALRWRPCRVNTRGETASFDDHGRRRTAAARHLLEREGLELRFRVAGELLVDQLLVDVASTEDDDAASEFAMAATSRTSSSWAPLELGSKLSFSSTRFELRFASAARLTNLSALGATRASSHDQGLKP